ncbi:unnamed protein product [Merluccius merluccius]
MKRSHGRTPTESRPDLHTESRPDHHTSPDQTTTTPLQTTTVPVMTADPYLGLRTRTSWRLTPPGLGGLQRLLLADVRLVGVVILDEGLNSPLEEMQSHGCVIAESHSCFPLR